jgi:hypothetical protein
MDVSSSRHLRFEIIRSGAFSLLVIFAVWVANICIVDFLDKSSSSFFARIEWIDPVLQSKFEMLSTFCIFLANAAVSFFESPFIPYVTGFVCTLCISIQRKFRTASDIQIMAVSGCFVSSAIFSIHCLGAHSYAFLGVPIATYGWLYVIGTCYSFALLFMTGYEQDLESQKEEFINHSGENHGKCQV